MDLNMSNPIDNERRKRLRMRNWAVFLALLGFVVLVYATTIVRMKTGAGL